MLPRGAGFHARAAKGGATLPLGLIGCASRRRSAACFRPRQDGRIGRGHVHGVCHGGLSTLPSWARDLVMQGAALRSSRRAVACCFEEPETPGCFVETLTTTGLHRLSSRRRSRQFVELRSGRARPLSRRRSSAHVRPRNAERRVKMGRGRCLCCGEEPKPRAASWGWPPQNYLASTRRRSGGYTQISD